MTGTSSSVPLSVSSSELSYSGWLSSSSSLVSSVFSLCSDSRSSLEESSSISSPFSSSSTSSLMRGCGSGSWLRRGSLWVKSEWKHCSFWLSVCSGSSAYLWFARISSSSYLTWLESWLQTARAMPILLFSKSKTKFFWRIRVPPIVNIDPLSISIATQ